MKKILKLGTQVLSIAYLYFITAHHALAVSWSRGDPANPDAAQFKDLEAVVENILNVFMSLAGLAVFVMIVLAGYKFMTSAGDPKAAGAAKSTMTWAIFGLLFLIGAWFILQFISIFTGIKVTTFTIPS